MLRKEVKCYLKYAIVEQEKRSEMSFKMRKKEVKCHLKCTSAEQEERSVIS
jgi:hypothetical protein